MDSLALANALREWESALGGAWIVQETPALHAASTGTFSTSSQVAAILRPGTREEVQASVRIANRHGVPLYPVSSGKNWGYGSRVPVDDGVLLDLGRLNRIVHLDEELAYVTIEPGVTQRQLYEFLRARGSRLWMDATGASPECSIIGNTMERGFGHTPLGDHAGNACAFEVVLPTGECVETGFGRFPGAKAGALGRWGVGPSLDGLFSQSNLGIVTRMSVWLMPEPECFEAFYFSCRTSEDLGPLIDALRPLRLKGTLRSVMHIANDYKVLAGTERYPWRETGGRTPLDLAAMAQRRRALNIGAWNGSGGLYGTRRQVRDARAQVRKALRGKVERLQFVNDRLLGVITRFAKPFGMVTGWDLSRVLNVLAPVQGLMKGTPTASPMSSAYWRKKDHVPVGVDPDRDGCGLLWCSPVFPNTGPHALEVARLATDILLAHGFEPQMSISLATERSAIAVTTISYDRDEPGEDARALACYGALMEALLSRGYPPYRLTVASMGYAAEDDDYGALLGGLKATLDPRGILAPGRYIPTAARRGGRARRAQPAPSRTEPA
jgi:4-cresol dehydrogenase (hydroxylating) flavoprotein subunit